MGPLQTQEGRSLISVAKNLALNLSLLFCAACAVASSATPESASNAVPVRIIGNYLMVVSVSINDLGPFDFLVDTGTNTTLIDPQLAAELALKPQDKLQLASLSNSVNVPRYRLQTIRVGPAAISNIEALAVPLTQLAALDGKIRGVLGMNFLLHFSFRLDYDQQAMEIYSFFEGAHAPTGLRVPVEINESRLLIKVESAAAPHGNWKLALDSGISQFLVFSERIAFAANADCGQPTCLMQVSTNLGQESASTVMLDDLWISDAHFPATQVVVLRNQLHPASDPQDGLLPASLFHSIYFDRTDATITFSPSPGAVSVAALLNQ
jgi:predicted aspartyl protease